MFRVQGLSVRNASEAGMGLGSMEDKLSRIWPSKKIRGSLGKGRHIRLGCPVTWDEKGCPFLLKGVYKGT